MREFKFRAWDKEDKSMEYFGLSDIYWIGESTGDYYFPEDLDVMQYTGLHDKAGKEIYEGDVIINGTYGKTIIRFDYGKFYAEKGEEWGWIDEDCEIIGNIYENKEKLK